MNIKTAWKPLFTQTNRATGTFMGVFDNVGTKSNGEEFTYTAAYFSVGGVKDNEKVAQDVEIRLTEVYRPENQLGKLAKALGFEYKEETQVDELGLVVPVSNNLEELDKLFDTLEGQVFQFKMVEDKMKGIWSIATPTIKPFTVRPN